jgi:hypothetical protein
MDADEKSRDGDGEMVIIEYAAAARRVVAS